MLGRSFALNELDWKLRKHLNYPGGVFVEAGANNGVDQTNSLHFERYLNWSGLLVFESSVLRGLDFQKYRPKFMLIEARFRKEIEEVIFPIYAPVEDLSEHDVLYRLL
ncbi:MAG: hypothetical protein EBS01_09385 [Verrucomicrobia bacterium]|nr:hypothetical protein [Verrucomicrobiota bacterium]